MTTEELRKLIADLREHRDAFGAGAGEHLADRAANALEAMMPEEREGVCWCEEGVQDRYL